MKFSSCRIPSLYSEQLYKILDSKIQFICKYYVTLQYESQKMSIPFTP